MMRWMVPPRMWTSRRGCDVCSTKWRVAGLRAGWVPLVVTWMTDRTGGGPRGQWLRRQTALMEWVPALVMLLGFPVYLPRVGTYLGMLVPRWPEAVS
jgi:hypothetical protein